jgi:urea transport system ATP-binding protein
MDSIVYLEGVTVSFEGFKALNNLNFIMGRGELRVVIGPNGAGKTTLLDVICGRVKPVEGRVIFGEMTEIRGMEEHRIARLGVARKFQTPSVFHRLTVRENLELAARPDKGAFASLAGRGRGPDVSGMLDEIGLAAKADEPAGMLSHGEKQWLEIGMAVVQNPKLVLVDEPVAGMSDEETGRTAELLEAIARERSVLVIEHDMEFVRRIARTITVMHEGAVLCEGPLDKVQSDPRVAEIYLGRERQRHARN